MTALRHSFRLRPVDLLVKAHLKPDIRAGSQVLRTMRYELTCFEWPNIPPGGPVRLELEPKGVIGGVHAGYNWQVDDVVFGIVSDANFLNLDDGQTIGIFAASSETNFAASLRIKVGFTVDRALFYLTGGAAAATIDHTIFAFGVTHNCNERWLTGYTVGGGIEYAFSDWLSAFVEYRWTDLGDVSIHPVPGLLAAHSIALDYHQVQAGVSVSLRDLFAGM